MKKCDESEWHVVRDNLKRHVEQLSVKIGERHLWKEGSLERAADYIESVYHEVGYSAIRQEFTAYGKSVRNIRAEKEGLNPEMVIIGAHYDTVPGSPGADDNASSIAAMLELSRLLRPAATNKRIIFAAFVNEESPCFGTEKMGSMVYARSLKEHGMHVEVMISLEMLGYFQSDERQKYPFPFMKYAYPSRADFLAVVGNYNSMKYVSFLKREIKRNSSLQVRSLVVPAGVAGINRSDNSSFWQYGFKAVMLTDTANYRNKNYHQETDTIDSLNFDSMTEIVKGIFYALQKF